MNDLRAFGLLIRWRGLQMKSVLPAAIAVQVMIGAGLVIGDGLLIPHLTRGTATFLATGGGTLALISVGLALAPQFVAQAKLTGLHDYLESFPVPRLTHLFAGMGVSLVISLPGLVIAMAFASLRYGIEIHPNPMVLLALLIVTFSSTALGYAVGLSVKNPMAIALAGNLILFFVMLFTPITFPIDRLPTWLADVDRVLPFWYMGELMRDTLTSSGGVAKPMLATSLWALIGLLVCLRAGRRQA